MIRRDFRRAVAAAEAELGRIAMPADTAHRVLSNVTRQRVPRRRLALAGLATVGVCVVAWALVVSREHRDTGPAASAAVVREPLLDGVEIVGGSPDVQMDLAGAGTRIGVRRGSRTLRIKGWGQVTLRAGASFRPVPGGVELSQGEADFDVDKRRPAAGSTFVRLPQGAIEIMGTRFSVAQRPDGGTVRLDEGAIRFHAPDGRIVALVPGESLVWPLPAASPEPVAPPAAPPRVLPLRATRPPPALHRESPVEPGGGDAAAAIVARIAALRAEGHYAELARELRMALASERRPLTRERLSFELGSVLSYHLPDRTQACAHWAEHRRAFPANRYAQEVSDVEKALRCNLHDGGGP